MKLIEAIAARTRNLMVEKNIFQKELERKANISHCDMDNILNSNFDDIDLKLLYKLSFGFGINIWEFFSGDLFDWSNLDL